MRIKTNKTTLPKVAPIKAALTSKITIPKRKKNSKTLLKQT